MPQMYRSLKAYCTTLSPPFLDVPTSAVRCPHARNDARDLSSERWNCVGENYPVVLPKWRLPRHLAFFYMPQIYDMGPTALLPLRRKARWASFRPEKSWRLRPGLNPRTWVLKATEAARSSLIGHCCCTHRSSIEHVLASFMTGLLLRRVSEVTEETPDSLMLSMKFAVRRTNCSASVCCSSGVGRR